MKKEKDNNNINNDKFHNKLITLRDEYKFSTDKLLQRRGWKWTCEIASIWLWKKEINGLLILTDKETALTIEGRIL
jgi:hypothetical protein